MFVRETTARGHRYLYLVESVREGKRVRQRTIRALGRKDVLQASGELDRLIASLARHSERSVVLSDNGGGRAGLRADRRSAAVRSAVGSAGPGRCGEGTSGRSRLRVRRRAGGVRERSAPSVRVGLGPVVREVDGRLRDRRDRGVAASPAVSGDGLARGGAGGAGGRRACAALREGCGGGASVRAQAGSVHRPVAGVHGHHDAVVPRRGRRDAGGARLLEGPSPGLAPDGSGGGAGRRGPACVHGDAAGQHGRHQGAAADHGPFAGHASGSVACAWWRTGG